MLPLQPLLKYCWEKRVGELDTRCGKFQVFHKSQRALSYFIKKHMTKGVKKKNQ